MEKLRASRFVHGRTKDPEYRAWASAKERCFNPRNKGYPFYGARGITMCDRWRGSFEAFFADVGQRPSSGHSIDRIDVNGNYEPGNVRWATRSEQMTNRRRRGIKPACKRGHPFGGPDSIDRQRGCRVCEKLRRERRRRLD